jgi:transglutaminase-like putative cysteine protease
MKLIQDGEFLLAQNQIKKLLDQNKMSEEEEKQLTFQLERMERIKKDFTKSENEVLEEIQEVIPNASPKDLTKWESSKALEMINIDGDKMYFKHAARNLFRIDQRAKKMWEKRYGSPDPNAPYRKNLERHIKKNIKQAVYSNSPVTYPARFKIRYTISLKPGQVPVGERVRCWIPYPREIKNRQVDIVLMSTFPEKYKIADNNHLQRTIYFEQEVKKDQPTSFSVEYAFTNHGIYFNVDPEKVVPVKTSGSLKDYLKEEPPHIVFTEELKKLSAVIVGNEQNPFLVAKKIYQWIGDNIPWASAREYSTISNISLYPAINRHGDCGIKALMFITMLRMNGIPARWQSGWEFQPPEKDNMHDWGMVYFEPYGWMPMDVDYGLRDSEEEKYKWFYLTGMDAYRLIFNDNISQAFAPVKTHHRSETVDSQRGELEWKGGNLYFDQWTWNMDWELISDASLD